MNQTIHVPQMPNERFKMVRNLLNYNQRDFAKKLDVKQAYISAIEIGKREVTSRMLNALLEKFNVSADWMLTGQGTMFLAKVIPALLTLQDKCHSQPYRGFTPVTSHS